MKTRCPCCGAENSLDALLAHDDGREVVRLTAQLGELAKPALQYLALFRPTKGSLSFGRTAKLLGELAADIQAGQISRNRIAHPAPPEAWRYGFQAACAARHTLKLPLKTHGWLHEVIAGWQPADTTAVRAAAEPQTAGSKLRQGVGSLQEYAETAAAQGNWLEAAVAQGMALLAAANLTGRPAATDWVVTAQAWLVGLKNSQREWYQARDSPRLQQAFAALLTQSTQFPSVQELLRHLPPVINDVSRALPQPKAERSEETEQIRRQAKQKLGIRPQPTEEGKQP